MWLVYVLRKNGTQDPEKTQDPGPYENPGPNEETGPSEYTGPILPHLLNTAFG